MTRHRLVALLAALGLILTACAADARRPPANSVVSVPATAPPSASTRPIATTTTTTEPGTTTLTAATTTTTEPPLGPITILQAGSGVPILVGGMFPFFGPAGDLGNAQADAVQLAVENFGDIDGHDVLLAPFEDSRCTVDGGRTAARSIVNAGPTIAGSPIVGLIGPTCSGAAIEAADLLVAAGFTVVAPTVDDPAFTSDLLGTPGALNTDGFFTVVPNPIALGDAAGRFVVEHLGSQTIAIIAGEEAPQLGEVFARTVEERGGSVAVALVLREDRLGARPVLRQLIDIEPDVIFIAMEPEAAGRILQVLNTIGPLGTVDRVLVGPPSEMTLGLTVGDAATYSVAFDNEPSGRDATGARYRDVRAEYERSFGRPPTPEAMRAYDATMLLLTAVGSVAEDRAGALVIDRGAIASAMREVGTRGFFGWLECDAFATCVQNRSIAYEDSGSLGATLANEVWASG